MTDQTTQRVSVVGIGYVGLPLVVRAAVVGFDAAALDLDPSRGVQLAAELPEGLTAGFSTDDAILEGSDVVVVCVPTPQAEGVPDLRYVEAACRAVAKHLRPGTLVAIESTIAPYTCRNVVVPILAASGFEIGTDVHLVHCPERINPGDPNWPLERIPRVLGGLTPACLEAGQAFYERLLDAPVRAMGTIEEAEAVKLVENTFRDVNIAFVNELAMSFDRMGLDVVNVIQGAATKPFAFLAHFPGAGVGGHCIPVDPHYLIAAGEAAGFNHQLLRLTRKTNERMPEYTAGLVEDEAERLGWNIGATTVGVLGLSYKPGIEDTRESPSFAVIDSLRERGFPVAVFDPYAPEQSTHDLDGLLAASRALVLCTAHEEFMALSPDALHARGIDLFVDGRNAFDSARFHEAGIVYRGIGRR